MPQENPIAACGKGILILCTLATVLALAWAILIAYFRGWDNVGVDFMLGVAEIGLCGIALGLVIIFISFIREK